MIQETHFNKGDSFTFASRRYPQIYQAFNPRKRTGVAILFKRGSPFLSSESYIDPRGHYIILRGQWQSQVVTICNLYAPNTHQINFLTKVFASLFRTPHEFLIVGGDFNLSHSSVHDRHTVDPRNSQNRTARESKLFRQITRRYALFDSWRAFHPGDRQYMFYSAPHHMHSRIDYLFVNNAALRVVKDTRIHPISWSDYAPIFMTLNLGSFNRRPCHWQLNTFLLQHLPSKMELDSALQHYFIENTTPEVSPSVLWEAHKAVLRGQCIALASAMKKDVMAVKVRTERELRALERKLQISPSTQLLKKIVCLCTTLKDLAEWKKCYGD